MKKLILIAWLMLFGTVVYAQQPINTAQVNGVTTLAGAGAVGTGSQRVAVGQDTTTIAGSAPGTAGSASTNVISIQGIASMTPVGVSVASGGIASGAVASGAIASGAVASGAFASGSIGSGAIASGAIASGAIASGACVSGCIADGGIVTLGAKADAKSTATDTTAITIMQVLKEISFMAQTPAALPANQSVNVAQIAGATTSTAASGVQKVGIVGNAGAIVDGATGAAPPANVMYVGGVTSGATGGFLTGIPVCDSFVNVNISTNTTTLLITGVSGRHIRVCAYDLQNNAADNVGIISGTGATCGTGTAAIVGTTAASGYNFAANGGISKGNGIGTVLRTVATGDSICLITSAATQLSGTWSYTIY